MSEKFEQISIKPGFMKHNGGLLFRIISKNEYHFKSTINKNHFITDLIVKQYLMIDKCYL